MSNNEEGYSGSYSDDESFNEHEYKKQYIKAYENTGHYVKSISVCIETYEVEIETSDGWNYTHSMITGKVFMQYHNDEILEKYNEVENESLCVIL